MKRILILATVTLTLTGCAGTSIFKGGTSFTATVQNPVTPAMLYGIENTATIAFAGLNAYRTACINHQADAPCRSNIAQLQVYTRQIPVPLKALRKFVRDNDQVNAITAFNTVRSLLDNFKATALSLGVK